MNSFAKEQQHRARVDHKCSLCGKIIPKRSEYMSIKGSDGISYWQRYYHLRCHAVVAAHGVYMDTDDASPESVGRWADMLCDDCDIREVCRRRGGEVYGCTSFLGHCLDGNALKAAIEDANDSGEKGMQ